MAEDNTRQVEHREKEINQIVRSIQDLNEIFKDLATMVVDQVQIHSKLRTLGCVATEISSHNTKTQHNNVAFPNWQLVKALFGFGYQWSFY